MRKILFLIGLLALFNLMLSAQAERGARIVHTAERSANHVPPQNHAAELTKIYSNLATPTDLYDDENGWGIEGPALTGFPIFGAIPFTPKLNSHVVEVGAAVHYFSGANQINLSIYTDAGGVPGTLLAGPITVANLPVEGTCCALAIARFPSVAVAGGTRYWVVVDTPLTGTGSDFNGGWSMVAKIVPIAFNDGSAWFPSTANDLPAGAVYGTVP
jgi:hypothetical protein